MRGSTRLSNPQGCSVLMESDKLHRSYERRCKADWCCAIGGKVVRRTVLNEAVGDMSMDKEGLAWLYGNGFGG